MSSNTTSGPPLCAANIRALQVSGESPLCAANIRALQASDASVSFHSLDGVMQVAKVVKVYDGDTIHCTMCTSTFFSPPSHPESLLPKIDKWSVRLFGIDTCEMRGRTRTRRQCRMALAAKEFVACRIFGELVVLQCLPFDKYGRLMANVWVDGKPPTCINQQLVEEDLAVEYNGGTKGVKVATSLLEQSLSDDDATLRLRARVSATFAELRSIVGGSQQQKQNQHATRSYPPPLIMLRRSKRRRRRSTAVVVEPPITASSRKRQKKKAC